MNTPYPGVPGVSERQQIVLVIDDNPTNLGVIVEYLKGYGYQMIAARDGESAFKRLHYVRPDIILLDVMMPEMDGFEVCRRLKAGPETSDIPVIFMTALDSTGDKVKGFAAGAVDYITKPIQQEELLARLATHLRLREMARSLQEQNEQLQNLTARLERRTRQLQMAAEAARDATAIADLDGLLGRAAALLVDRFNVYSASIFLLDDLHGHAVLRAAAGPGGTAMLEQELTIRLDETSIVSYVIGSGQVYLASNVSEDPLYLEHPLLLGVSSEMTLPLKAGGRVTGVLDVQSQEQDGFDDVDAQALQTVADQLAVAIEKTRLFAQIQSALEERLRTVVSNAPVVMFGLDGQGIFTLVEGPLAPALGCQPETVLGRKAAEVWRQFPDNLDRVQRALAGEESVSLWSVEDRIFEAHWSPLLGPQGVIRGVTAVATDITERRRAEIELAAAYRKLERLDKTKSDFIDLVAHELRSPLTLIMGYTHFLSGALPDDVELGKYFNGVMMGVERISEIVNSLLDVARIDTQTLDACLLPVAVGDIIRRISIEFADTLKERHLHFTLNDLETLPAIIADPDLMYKLFYHLITNAIKYTPDGGTISIGGEHLVSPGERACIQVVISDTGIGIDPAHQELVFDKFYQTIPVSLHSSGKTKYKGGGPGLGLAIARGIVVVHDGKIWVESPGFDEASCPGSTFFVRLPVA